jgi:hypothetical protein
MQLMQNLSLLFQSKSNLCPIPWYMNRESEAKSLEGMPEEGLETLSQARVQHTQPMWRHDPKNSSTVSNPQQEQAGAFDAPAIEGGE